MSQLGQSVAAQDGAEEEMAMMTEWGRSWENILSSPDTNQSSGAGPGEEVSGDMVGDCV